MQRNEKTTFSVGDKITRRYAVQQVLLGGVSEVYLCTEKQMKPLSHAYTVLKTLQPQYRAQLPEDVFKREIQTWIDIPNHTYIVPCLGVLTFNHIPFMVLEYIAGSDEFGTSLRDWLKHRPLTLMHALEFLIQICQGLDAVNQYDQTIVHCDIKPDNILVQFGAVARLTDFGLARILSPVKMSTSSGDTDNIPVNHKTSNEVLGTPAYMPPEQWMGETLDVRSDIYGLGCTLFELVTGRWPYQGPTIRRMRDQHLEAAIPTLPATGDDLHQLNDVFVKCLAKDKNQRYLSAAELASDLEMVFNKIYRGVTSPIRALITPQPIPMLLARVPVYLHLNDYEKARITIEQAFKLIDDGADTKITALVYGTRGLYHLEIHHYEKALADYSTAISLSPDDAEMYADRSRVYLETAQYEAALHDCVTAIRLDATCLPAYQNQAVAYENLGKIEQTLQTYAMIIKTFGEATPNEIYINLGHCYTKLGYYQEAIVNYDRAIQLNPQYGDGYYDRGTAYLRLGRYEIAIADLTKAITLNSEYISQAYGNRATCHAQLNQFEYALSDIDLALAIDDRNSSTLATKANIYQSLGRYDEALKLYDEAIAIDPNNASNISNRGVLQKSLGNFNAALHDFDAAIELEPTLVAAHINKANLIESLEQYDKTLEIYNRAISLCPDEMNLYLRRARLLLSRDDLDTAMEDVNTILNKIPREVEALKLRGSIYFEQSQYYQALEDFKQASRLDPTSAATHLGLATVYEILGEYENAEQHLKLCVQLRLPNAEAKLHQIRYRIAFNKFPYLNSLEEAEAFILEYPFVMSEAFINELSTAAEKMPTEFKSDLQKRIEFFRERMKEMQTENVTRALIEAQNIEAIKTIVRNNDELKLTMISPDFWFEFMNIAVTEYGLARMDVMVKQRLIVHALNNL